VLTQTIFQVVESNWNQRWAHPSIEHYRQLLDQHRASPDSEGDADGSVIEKVSSWISAWNPWNGPAVAAAPQDGQVSETRSDEGRTLLFVYGTLKRGFHWNSKYLGLGASLIASRAVTVDKWRLVVGDSGVPYLLNTEGAKSGDSGEVPIVGEVWSVDDECLDGLDEYEGCGKGYYDRVPVKVYDSEDGGTELTAQVYCWSRDAEASADLLERPCIAEYTRKIHDALYSAIRHIQVKQELYLGVNDDQN
jgi:gamma-glutamylcyclotransferase (GGCT)/AIG2-like uncharacterized protein YtfP